MTRPAILVLGTVLLTAAGCARRDSDRPHSYEADRAAKEAAQRDADTAARKAGRAAYGITKEAEKAAKAAGRKIGEATREAHQGWKEAERESKAKKRAGADQ